MRGEKTQTRIVATHKNSTVLGYNPGKELWDRLQLDKAWVDTSCLPEWSYLHASIDIEGDVLVYRVRSRIEPSDCIKMKEALVRDPAGCVAYESDAQLVWVDGQVQPWKWTRNRLPGIFMPNWAVRRRLKVISVRGERIQNISPADCQAEGLRLVSFPETTPEQWNEMYREAFQELWDRINADRGHPWEKNEWVWAYEFEEVK